jgi:colicin import membrane protein
MLFLFALLFPVDALLRGTAQGTDLSLALNDMHPEAVNKLLHAVELRWEESRSLVLENKTDASDAENEMLHSCKKVARAIIDGSEGDKDKVVEYMQDVCTVNTAAGEEDKSKCMAFSSAIEKSMADDARFNRDELDLAKLCQSYWAGPVTAAAEVQARTDEADAAKKAQEEAEKAAEEAKRAEEQAAADAQTQMSNQLQDAVNKSATAMEHVAQVEEEVSELEASMASDDANATKFLDQARQEAQVAEEKEVKVAEAEAQKSAIVEAANSRSDAPAEKVEKADSLNATSVDEEAAIKEGDAQAEAIAEKAMKKAEAAPAENTTAAVKAAENTTKAQDDSKAIAAGDALAQKIADKALKKVGLIAKKF